MSNLHQLYHQMGEQLRQLARWKRPEHYKVLSWLMVAIFVGKDVCLDRLGLGLPIEAKPESVAQQFRRWLKNKAINERLIYDPVARQVLRKMRCRRLRIQVDRVQIKKRQNVLMMSVWYRNRAIPLAWICLPHSGSSQLSHWRDLLDYLEEILPDDAAVILLADREFGSVDRLHYVQRKRWQYAIRLKGSVFFYDPAWKHPFDWYTLNQIAPLPGKAYAIPDLCLTKGDLYLTHIACAWAVGSVDPWFVATNLPNPIQALKEYARRFGCEELFSDLKKRGFNWEDTMIRDPQRISRLLLALALLVVFLLILGRRIRLARLDLEILSPSHRFRLSLFQTARRWLHWRLARNLLPDFLFENILWQFV